MFLFISFMMMFILFTLGIFLAFSGIAIGIFFIFFAPIILFFSLIGFILKNGINILGIILFIFLLLICFYLFLL